MAGRKGDSSGNLIFGPKVEFRRRGLDTVALSKTNSFASVVLLHCRSRGGYEGNT